MPSQELENEFAYYVSRVKEVSIAREASFVLVISDYLQMKGYNTLRRGHRE